MASKVAETNVCTATVGTRDYAIRALLLGVPNDGALKEVFGFTSQRTEGGSVRAWAHRVGFHIAEAQICNVAPQKAGDDAVWALRLDMGVLNAVLQCGNPAMEGTWDDAQGALFFVVLLEVLEFDNAAAPVRAGPGCRCRRHTWNWPVGTCVLDVRIQGRGNQVGGTTSQSALDRAQWAHFCHVFDQFALSIWFFEYRTAIAQTFSCPVGPWICIGKVRHNSFRS